LLRTKQYEFGAFYSCVQEPQSSSTLNSSSTALGWRGFCTCHRWSWNGGSVGSWLSRSWSD